MLEQLHFDKEGVGFNPKPKILQSSMYTHKKNINQKKVFNVHKSNLKKHANVNSQKMMKKHDHVASHSHNHKHVNAFHDIRLKHARQHHSALHKAHIQHAHLHRNAINKSRKPHKYYTPRYMFNANVICHYCNKIGHISPVCFTRHRHLSNNSDYHMHIPNKQGPKKIWVPKSSC